MWNVVGHEREVAALARVVGEGHPPHALLLTGPAGVGKTHLAIELARALNCTGEAPPCGDCVHCRQIEHGAHPDVTLMETAEGKDSIAISQIREMREGAALRPYQGRWKVYVVAGAESLTAQAADALLKTLEEPQAQVVLILTASDPEALPATVVSRCTVVRLRAVDASTVAEALRKRGMEAAEAEHLARLSRGSVGWALRAVSQPKLAAAREELVERLVRVPDLTLADRLDLAESLTSERKDRSGVRRSLELLLLLGRDLLLMHQGLEPELAVNGHRETLRTQVERLSLAEINAYMQRIRLAMDRIDANVDPRLALEALLVGDR